MKNAFAVAAALCLGIVTGSASDAVRTLAGAAQVPGHVDGVGALARFSDPAGLAIDAQGNVLIADSANHCLRKLTPAGIVTTIAGRPGDAGSADGPGATARFDTPSAVAVAKDGTVFVSDTGNHTLRRIGRDGSVSTWAGSAGDPGATNAVGRAARFSSPLGIAIAKDGALFVADSANHAIRRVGADGAVTTFAGATEEWGATDGKAAQARFEGPVALAFGPNGSLFVSDALNHAVRRIAPDGTVSTFAGKLGDDGFADGPPGTARLGKPAELAFDARGDLYVVDAFHHTLRKIAPDGTLSTVAGLAGSDGDADGSHRAARFFNPYGLATTSAGALVVADTYNDLIREIAAPFALSTRKTADGSAVVRWESTSGKRYRVLRSDSLTAPWQVLGSPVTATSDTSETTDPSTTLVRFYQVERLD